MAGKMKRFFWWVPMLKRLGTTDLHVPPTIPSMCVDGIFHMQIITLGFPDLSGE